MAFPFRMHVRSLMVILFFLVVVSATRAESTSSLASSPEEDDASCLTLEQIVCTIGGFEILCNFMQMADLEWNGNSSSSKSSKSSNSSNINNNSNTTTTLFAPTDQAFENLDPALLEKIQNDTDLLQHVLGFHVLQVPQNETTTTDMLECSERITMFNGHDSRTVCSKDGRMYQKGGGNDDSAMPEIIVSNVVACNGHMHVVSHVMLPGNVVTGGGRNEDDSDTNESANQADVITVAAAECRSISDFICETRVTSMFCDFLTQYGLLDDLSQGNWTVFVPYNPAFAEIPSVGSSFDSARSLLMFHAVYDSVLMDSQLECGSLLEMANGQTSRTFCKTFENVQVKNQKGADNKLEEMPRIIAPNNIACNGIVHLTDRVLLPSGALSHGY
mmetsp:Transcript_27162/g.48015  ORF Transcript_27162/g.48015 Transcript_27162/m.48015 type:complete len:388 (+) Transcript_27162:242-1405(+)